MLSGITVIWSGCFVPVLCEFAKGDEEFLLSDLPGVYRHPEDLLDLLD